MANTAPSQNRVKGLIFEIVKIRIGRAIIPTHRAPDGVLMSTTLSVNNHEIEITKRILKIFIYRSIHPMEKLEYQPLKIEDSSIKAFVLTKLEWIKKHQNRLKIKKEKPKENW